MASRYVESADHRDHVARHHARIPVEASGGGASLVPLLLSPAVAAASADEAAYAKLR